MDYCRNIAVSGGLPSEYQPEQVLSSSCSKLGSLDDLFSGHNPEGDVSMEWLSTFVEDCFSNSGNCFPQIPPNQQLQSSPSPHSSTTTTTTTTTIKAPNQVLQKTTSIAAPKPPQEQLKQQQEEQSSTSPSPRTPLNKFAIPGQSRTKRKRTPVLTKPKSQITKWSQSHHLCSSDPPLLHQAHWLADSELMVMPKTAQIGAQIGKSSYLDDEEEDREMDEEEEEIGRRNLEEGLMMIMSHSHGQEQQQQQTRRCTHCLSQKTPQWRAGPLGPKTLCNACGVRYKSGRLLPEYRPAKSPTFVSFKHSNSHKKVMEMRNTLQLPKS